MTTQTDGLVLLDNEFIVNELVNSGNSNQEKPKVTALADGGYVIVYETEQGSDVALQQFDAEGNKVGSEKTLGVSSLHEIRPEVSDLSDGGYVVSWSSTSGNLLSFQRFDSLGNSVGTQVDVSFNQNVDGSSDLTLLESGDFLVTWTETTAAQGREVFARLYSPDGSLFKDTFQVTQGLSGSEQEPSVAALSDGGFIISFDQPDGSNMGVAAQRFDSDGNAAGQTFQVNDYTINNQFSSSVIGLGGGGFVVAWTSTDQYNPTSERDVVFKIYDQSGLSTGEVILSDPNVNQLNAELTALSDGGFVVVYEAGFSNDWNIYAQRYNSDGTFNGDLVQVNQTPGGDHMPDVTELENGDLIFTWYGINADLGGYDIYARTVQAPGNQVQPEGFVALADEVVLGGATDYQLEAKVTALEDGGYVVSYQAQESGTSNWNVYLQRFASDGSPVGTEILVNTSDYDERGVDIASLSNGGYVVSWMSMISSPNTSQIKMQIFDDQGLPVGTEISVSGTTYGPAQAATTVLENGNIVVTWRETQPDTSSMDILAKIYSPDGSLLVDEFQVNTQVTGTQQSPSIDSLSDGGFIVSYDSGDGAGYGVFAQRFDADGNLVGDELQINDTTLNHQWTSSVTALENGGLVVAWTDRVLTDISSENVVFKVYDSAGQSVGEVEIADPGVRESQVNVTALSDGGFVLAYQITNSPDSEIFMQRYNADGSVSGDLQQISTNNRAFSPDVAELANGDVVVSWHAIDSSTGSYLVHSRTFEAPGNTQVDPVPANNAPELNNVVTDVQLDESDSINFSLPVGLFSDPDGDVLTISATLADGSDLPDWLVFDAASQSFSGSAVDAGSYEIEVSAFDGEFTTSTRFTIDVEAAPAPVNTAPVVDQGILDHQAHMNENYSFEIPDTAFSDLDGDVLQYTARLADGQPLPSWLKFDGQTFSGKPTSFTQPLQIEVIASDGFAESSTTFELEINSPVVGWSSLFGGTLREGSSEGFNLGAHAFIDLNGRDTLDFTFKDSQGGAVDWLTVDYTQHGWTVSGSPNAENVGRQNITMIGSDGHFSREVTLRLDVIAANKGPEAGASDMKVVLDSSSYFFKVLPDGLFSDPNGDDLTYSIDVFTRPDWLYFGNKGTLYARSNELFESVDLEITASDGEFSAINSLKVEVHKTVWTEQAMTFDDGSTGRILVQDVDGDATLQADEALVVNDSLANVDDLTILRLYQATSTDATSTQFEVAKASSDVSTVAQGLVESSGFVALADADESGSVSNDELIAHLYNANYGRSATTAEESYWQSRFNTDGATQGEVVAEFSSSDEYADASTEAVANLIHQNEDWWA